MWRLFIILCAVQLAFAGTVDIEMYLYDKAKNQISKMGKQTYAWGGQEKNRAVYELKLSADGKLSLSVDSEDVMYHRLREATRTELVPMEAPAFDRKLRFIIDDNDRLFSAKDIVFRFEETNLVDEARQLYTIRYYALNKKEMREKFGKTNNGTSLDEIDGRGDVKMILGESDKFVNYLVFNLRDKESKTRGNLEGEKDKIYENESSDISAPFVYALQYENLHGNKFTIDRISQDETFEIPVAGSQEKTQQQGDKRNFAADLVCIVLPQKYQNDKLAVDVIITSRLSVYRGRADDFHIKATSYSKTLEFDKDDVIQIKLPKEWPGKIYGKGDEYAFGDRNENEGWRLLYNAELGEQYITIRPIKIQ